MKGLLSRARRRPRSTRCAGLAIATLLVATGSLQADVVVGVVKQEQVYWDPQAPEPADPEGYVARHGGQVIDRTVRLPAAPADQRDARRIVATVRVRPRYTITEEGRRRPNDRWTRLGSLSVLVPGEGGARELELMRFTTAYGAPSVFEQDVTVFAPHLHGTQTLRTFVSTYSDEPGFEVSVELTYTTHGVGQRRPVFAAPVVNDPHVTRQRPSRGAVVEIPSGLDRPRLRVITTGHATDGRAGNEFLSCTHVLRVDGREIARWRPWSEEGGPLRDFNPTSGRWTIDGRELRSSDLDRSGWHPGLAVEPAIIPLPELTPGRHAVEIEILDIRAADPPGEDGKRHHGYWVLSAAVVADEPWPAE